MLDVREQTDTYAARFEQIESGTDRAFGPASIMAKRKAAFARFGELGFPTTKHEEWRFTNVAPIANKAFEVPLSEPNSVSAETIAPYTIGAKSTTLVFVDGRFAPQLSNPGKLPEGAIACSLSEALANGEPMIEEHLARYATFDDQAFTALNTALMEDGAFIRIPNGKVVEEPIQVLYLTTGRRPTVCHPRNLFIVGENAQATIVESYVSPNGGVYFTNPVTELVAEQAAVVDHYKAVLESAEAYHVGAFHLHQHRSSNVTSNTLSMGGKLIRNDINTKLDGEGCLCTLNGAYVIDDSQHVDNHLVVDHIKAHCDSREFFKGVLNGHSRGVFSGRINVHKGAQKTDAKQTNQSLLLSEHAQVESKPQLEIFADDVKCTHGATIGQIDEEAIFYLRTRGLCAETARSLLVYAFAREIIDQVRVEPLRAQLDDWLIERLPQGRMLREKL